MKKFTFMILASALAFTSCKTAKQTSDSKTALNEKQYEFYGQDFTFDNKVKDKDYILKQYQNLQKGDTIQVSFISDIKEVCQNKGCWMYISLDEKSNSFVRFKDYGFFAPMDSQGQDIVVNGKAFVSILEVAQLRHYAQDAGKSPEQIQEITKPEIIYGFLADGIAIKKQKEQ